MDSFLVMMPSVNSWLEKKKFFVLLKIVLGEKKNFLREVILLTSWKPLQNMKVSKDWSISHQFGQPLQVKVERKKKKQILSCQSTSCCSQSLRILCLQPPDCFHPEVVSARRAHWQAHTVEHTYTHSHTVRVAIRTFGNIYSLACNRMWCWHFLQIGALCQTEKSIGVKNYLYRDVFFPSLCHMALPFKLPYLHNVQFLLSLTHHSTKKIPKCLA